MIMTPSLGLPVQKLNYRRAEVVAGAVALGMTEASTKQFRKTAPARLAALIEIALAAGDVEAAERMYAPVETAMARPDLPRDEAGFRDLVLRAQMADLDEERAEAEFQHSPSATTTRAWVNALDKQMALARQLRAALKASIA